MLLSMYRSSNPLATGYVHILITMYINTIHNIAKMISYSSVNYLYVPYVNFKHVQQYNTFKWYSS